MNSVLVIDDALTIRKYHRQLLEEIGYQVTEAENGIEALEKLLEHKIDLCLVDVNMPLMDGFTFVRELRKGDYSADCPVIMITTESKPADEVQGYQSGVNLYLIKPAAAKTLQTYCRLLISGERQ